MRKKIRDFFCALLAGVIFFCTVPAEGAFVCAEATEGEFSEQLYATAAVLMDASSGRVLYGKNADTPLAMASTTKIMTCILVLELGDEDEELEISAYAATSPKVHLNVRRGEHYRVGDLLYSLMLESHNDAAVALAEYVGSKYSEGTLSERSVSEYTTEESKQAVAAFAALMNEKAKSLGCDRTWFITPNGLDASETVAGETKEHCTTATELARIMSYCILESPKAERFLGITQTPSYSFTANGRSYSCVNHNAFLNMMPGAISGKTGFTNKAGYCYVGALKRDGRTFVVALLACGWPNNKNYKWSDTKKLMEYGLDRYTYQAFPKMETIFAEQIPKALPVTDGTPRRLGEASYVELVLQTSPKEEEGLSGLLMRSDEEVTVEVELKNTLTAPVKKETEVGRIVIKVNGECYREESIVTAETVEKINLSWCFEQTLRRYLLY